MSGAGVERGVLVAALEAVHDPHVPVSLRAMGMLGEVSCDEAGRAKVEVRMPCMACPGAAHIVEDVTAALEAVDGVREVQVELAWAAGWQRDEVDPKARRLMRDNGILM